MEEIQTRHRKELKTLDGEKRASLKKTKATAGKGKKAKEMLAEVEAEFEKKLKELEAKHAKELAEAAGSSGDATAADASPSPVPPPAAVAAEEPAKEETKTAEEEERERKQSKARRKREKQKEKERERELQIERENAEAGPSARQIEVEAIQSQIKPLGLQISEVQADGNCLYRAVAAHSGGTYQETRNLCADTLLEHESEFAPFCEYDDNIPDFAHYVDRVRNSSDWGGHLELRVLSLAMKKHIMVYSAQSREPLHIKPEQDEGDDEPIRLSYHLHYYTLGEHYNRVVNAAT